MGDKEISKKSQVSEALTTLLAPHSEPENQLKVLLDFMRDALTQTKSPRLRDFWDAKTLCLPLFKKRLNPATRGYFWDEFVELSNEARRLKEVLDEQSIFAQEQIDLAIAAVEADLDKYDQLLEHVPVLELPKIDCIQKRKDFYHAHYRELSLLTTFSNRLNSLRQEVVKTSMRIRQKSRIIAKLQSLKEQVIPKRQEQIRALSAAFIEDVNIFIDLHKPKPTQPFYLLRDEIKSMQELSKVFTVSTDAFTQTREQLSGFWDEIRKLDKERKREMSEKKHKQQDNHAAAQEKLKELEEHIDAGDATDEQIDDMYKYLRHLDLHRDSVNTLKSQLQELQKKLSQPKFQEASVDKTSEKLDEFKEKIQSALDSTESAEDLQKQINILRAFQREHTIEHTELLDGLEDLWIDRTCQEKLEPDEVLIEDVNELIAMRTAQRERFKMRLEALRKIAGSSSLDFEKSMQVDEEIKIKKEQLEDVEQAIAELSDLVADA